VPKGALPESKTATFAEELRDRLRQLEIDAGNLRHRQIDVEALLRERDELEAMLSKAEQDGLDVRAERGRVQTVDGLLRSGARHLMRLLAKKGGFAAARARNAPPESNWWWYLDVFVKERQKKRIIRTAIVLASVALVLVGVNYILTKFFGPSPEQRAFNDLTYEAERALGENDDATAIAKYEEALAILPTEPDTWAMLGALYERQGRAEKAQEAFAKALEYSESQVMYWFSRAQAYIILGDSDRAYAMAQEAVAADPNSPYAYFVLGSALEAKGDRTNAAVAFDKAATLAMEQGNHVLYAMARERQAVLLGGGM